MLEDIDKETVDFRPNYDESEVEPEVPTGRRVPNLLINGSEGIAVGMKQQDSGLQPDRDYRSADHAGEQSGHAVIGA